MQRKEMVKDEQILIVGAGISGLSTALGLHRLGIRSLVLESSDSLRITGFALTMWTNAWRALDALGIGEYLRTKSVQIHGFQIFSPDSSPPSSENTPQAEVDLGNTEIRCVKRKDLLETLEKELPKGTIRYSSKLVSIEQSDNFKLVHLADGSVIKTKVLIGCDGINSMVAKWLGLQNPVNVGRSAIRGFLSYPNGHGLEAKFHAYFGGGVRYGFLPCDDKSIYWFCTFTPSIFNYDENEQNPLKMKQFVLSNIQNAPKRVSDIVERTELDCISYSPLKFRSPWNILLGHIVHDNVCVVGDAFHPMTPDIGQGGCSALEDSVVLARCLAETLLTKTSGNNKEDGEYVKMEGGLQKYAKERRWRSFSLISTAYIVGMIQESNGKVISFLRKSFLSKYTVGILMRMADFDCGKLKIS
ncbi:zeaxanthin epoxidase, chloroplastic-like [Olea europaea subsp. europaea]|uniref:Zeaxanthin epoxidase, chloroplastic-like n=1 Tax=Olea europaea subsp. europaea TaxID=158383 RepID=A0A8S0UUC4_OLEEU|nr:zeaxanthin epoxidase, chloroplastic-like [Olea europaea subsp. europaea]